MKGYLEISKGIYYKTIDNNIFYFKTITELVDYFKGVKAYFYIKEISVFMVYLKSTEILSNVVPTMLQTKEPNPQKKLLSTISFRIGNNLFFRDMKYYLGADNFSCWEDLRASIINAPDWLTNNQGYSSQLKRRLFTSDIIEQNKKQLPTKALRQIFLKNVNASQIIFCAKPNVEYKNVVDVDFSSFYISMFLSNNFPTSWRRVTKAVPDKINLLKVTFTNIKAKSPYCLSTCNYVAATNQTMSNKRLYSADSVTVWIFEEELYEYRTLYNFDSYSISEVWSSEPAPLPFNIPKVMIEELKLKSIKKTKGENYQAQKIFVNRISGIIGEKDKINNDWKKDSRRDWYCYMTALARKRMCEIINLIGYENVVYAHTDGLVIPRSLLYKIDEFNSKLPELPYGVGKLDFDGKDGIWKRCTFYCATRGKIETISGKTIIKAGGLSTAAVEKIPNATYDNINENTIVYEYGHRIIRDIDGITTKLYKPLPVKLFNYNYIEEEQKKVI